MSCIIPKYNDEWQLILCALAKYNNMALKNKQMSDKIKKTLSNGEIIDLLDVNEFKKTKLEQYDMFQLISKLVYDYCNKFPDISLANIELQCRNDKLPLYFIAGKSTNISNNMKLLWHGTQKKYVINILVSPYESFYDLELKKSGYKKSIDNYQNLYNAGWIHISNH